MLTIDNLGYQISNKFLFKNVSFSMFPGSLIWLKGPNGSGKTTLLKLIAGLNSTKFGRILCNDINIQDEIDTYHQHFVCYHGLQNGIKEDLTVIQNIKFWADLKNNIELVYPALSYLKLDFLVNTPCYKLSSGWKKRVDLAKIIVSNSKIWILDEPDAFLDDEAKEMLQKLITTKVNEGGIVIFSSHNINDIPNSCVLNINDFKI